MKIRNKRAIASKCRYVDEKIIEGGRIYEKNAGEFLLQAIF